MWSNNSRSLHISLGGCHIDFYTGIFDYFESMCSPIKLHSLVWAKHIRLVWPIVQVFLGDLVIFAIFCVSKGVNIETSLLPGVMAWLSVHSFIVSFLLLLTSPPSKQVNGRRISLWPSVQQSMLTFECVYIYKYVISITLWQKDVVCEEEYSYAFWFHSCLQSILNK